MIKVGLTGNIGSGKTYVSEIFKTISVPVYNSDYEAKKFLTHTQVKTDLFNHFGEKIITNYELDIKKLASIVFVNSNELNYLNNLIHPLVAEDFEKWCITNKKSSYVIIETAILFESGFNKLVDKTIVVTAPLEIRLERIINRDKCRIEEVRMKMKNQWDEQIKVKLADFEIVNDGHKDIRSQILEIHEHFLKLQA